MLRHLISFLIDLLNDKQTHNLSLTTSLADYVVVMGADGKISQQGSPLEILECSLVEQHQGINGVFETDEVEDEVLHDRKLDTTNSNEGKLIMEEDIQIGRVSGTACEYSTMKFAS
jgi:ABC-type glutathione transport system ATPase component